jgi:menaquinone-dependent protoporphyrinogen IX oxidase
MAPSARTLVVFHSRSGRTRRIGRMIAARLKADVEEIAFTGPAHQAPGYASCAVRALMGCTARVKPARHDPAQYDLVVIGTPVWCWSLPAPVRGWLKAHPLGPARAAFFCTMGGSGAARVFAQLRQAGGKRPRAVLALTEAQVEAGPRAAVDAYCARLAGSPAHAEATEAPATPTAPTAPPAPTARATAAPHRQAHSGDAHRTG